MAHEKITVEELMDEDEAFEQAQEEARQIRHIELMADLRDEFMHSDLPEDEDIDTVNTSTGLTIRQMFEDFDAAFDMLDSAQGNF